MQLSALWYGDRLYACSGGNSPPDGFAYALVLPPLSGVFTLSALDAAVVVRQRLRRGGNGHLVRG